MARAKRRTMVRAKRRTMVVEDAMFEGGLERRDVRVTFRADMTVEQALQAGILLATEFMNSHIDWSGFTTRELANLGINWRCTAAERTPARETTETPGAPLYFGEIPLESGSRFLWNR